MKLYTDASFNWKTTEQSEENVVRGKIAIHDDNNFKRIENVVVGKVPQLRQYNNVFELIAIARAVELASEENPKAESLSIYTDSKTAMYWARAGKIKKASVLTEAHASALEYLRQARAQFGGNIKFNFIPREQNLAGFLLQE